MLESVYGSKFYKASKYTDRINAAIANPLNIELVNQLSSYLDDEYHKLRYLDPDKLADEQDQLADEQDQLADNSIDDIDSDLAGLEVDGDFNEDNLVRYPNQDSGELEIDNDNSNLANDTDSISSVNNATTIAEDAVAVNSSTDLDIDVLKGTLNSRNDTQGITRVQKKENELWLYYSDNTNLNNIMTDVIEYISEASTSLIFNRLARSENAIVFEINDF